MRVAWLFGVLFFQPHLGLAAFGGDIPQPLTEAPMSGLVNDQPLLFDDGDLPPIALAPLPERSSPEPVAVRDEISAYGPRVVANFRPVRQRHRHSCRARRPAPVAQAPIAVLSSVAEVEDIGEDLRDAVASGPSLDGFLAALRDPDPSGRCEAITAYGYAGNFAAIPYVGAVLFRMDEELPVRLAAARALGRIGDRRARSFLARAVLDREPRVRLAAAVAWGLVADRGESVSLSRALQSETDDNVRAALAWALEAAKARRS
jgi:hypothetical protein